MHADTHSLTHARTITHTHTHLLTHSLSLLLHLDPRQLDQAERLMNIAVKVKEQLQGRDHPSVAEALLHCGKIATQQGKIDDAKEYQLRANRVMGARSRKATRSQKESDEKQGTET